MLDKILKGIIAVACVLLLASLLVLNYKLEKVYQKMDVFETIGYYIEHSEQHQP
jgi:hypothetical protein